MPYMNIFLTGATGNAGNAILNELLKQNHIITCLTRSNSEHNVALQRCKLITGDLSQIKRFAQELSESDLILHCASPRSLEKEIVFNEDILAMKNMLDAWRKGKFIYLSSQTVMGIPHKEFMTEQERYDPSNWYDLAKVFNENQLVLEELTYKRKCAITLRIPLLFSIGPKRYDRQLLPGIYRHCKNNGTFLFDSIEKAETCGSSILGDQDCGRFAVEAMRITESGVYHIASDFVTWKYLIEYICSKINRKPNIVTKRGLLLPLNSVRLPQSRSYLSIDKFTGSTGFIPSERSEDILDRCLFQYNKELL